MGFDIPNSGGHKEMHAEAERRPPFEIGPPQAIGGLNAGASYMRGGIVAGSVFTVRSKR